MTVGGGASAKGWPPAAEGPRGSAFAALSPVLLYGGLAAGLYGLRSGWAGILGYHLAICLALTLGRGWGGGRALLRGWGVAIGLGLAVAAATAGVLVALLWPVIRLEAVTMGSGLASVGLVGAPWIAFMAYYAVVNPWLEELFWRGFYPSRVRPGLVADLLFAGYHVMVMVLFVKLPWALLTFAVLVAVAFVWRAVARRQGGLAVPVASHMAADVSIVAAAAFLAASGPP